MSSCAPPPQGPHPIRPSATIVGRTMTGSLIADLLLRTVELAWSMVVPGFVLATTEALMGKHTISTNAIGKTKEAQFVLDRWLQWDTCDMCISLLCFQCVVLYICVYIFMHRERQRERDTC